MSRWVIQPAFASSAVGIVFPFSSVALQTSPASPLIQVTSYHFPLMFLKLSSLLQKQDPRQFLLLLFTP